MVVDQYPTDARQNQYCPAVPLQEDPTPGAVLQAAAAAADVCTAAGDADLQYLLGADLIVAPITEFGGERSCWIPPGHWLPLWGAAPAMGPRLDYGAVRTGPGVVPARRPRRLDGLTVTVSSARAGIAEPSA